MYFDNLQSSQFTTFFNFSLSLSQDSFNSPPNQTPPHHQPPLTTHNFHPTFVQDRICYCVMEEHLILSVDRLITPEPLQPVQGAEVPVSSRHGSCSHSTGSEHDGEYGGEEDPLIQSVECRICQEEDSTKNLEVPCACNGSLKFAHRKCVQRWCNEKGDTTCEICHQVYQPGYTAPPPTQSDETVIDINGGWTLGGAPIDLHDPRLLAMAAAERRLLEGEYDEYEDTSASGAAFCRSAALILMALLLLRHTLTIGDGDDEEDDASAFFALFLLRAAGFLLPCYIMAWAISILQRRRQRQEVAALAATDVAFMIQAGGQQHHRGLQVTIAPSPSLAPVVPSVAPPPALTSAS